MSFDRPPRTAVDAWCVCCDFVIIDVTAAVVVDAVVARWGATFVA